MKFYDKDIKKWIENGKILIKPKPKKNNIKEASIDIHLGNKFRVFNKNNHGYIDLKKYEINKNNKINKIISKEINISNNKKFYLYPQEMALGITKEYVNLPNNLIGTLYGRSSLARIGLMIHITANRIDPGWCGNIVLEFYNFNKLPLLLYPGMIIGALSFEKLSGYVKRSYNTRKNSKYKNQKNILNN
ncbi:dCTP deaminase [Candidatus Purcelliella pentastirinorum]|uniref:dCTP deaminase n=1 Tax=Candidatus Purcelliella pentastirinorum TaxID=472834 RepID=A0AAX3N8Y0_9ENTR|nr:dCTP deaminase [Candidatus Purcelliella pentastirinorum]WDI78464.1 dCTP deaminase [Candidatus Purcelliella pentastirinorum]WDR80507.1 dCTP deaminase [Candidatus Purcelliella pentastirinorum]